MTSTSLNNVSVLCVDNYIDSLELLKVSLELCGARVCGAVSLDDAVRAFHVHHPNVLISDLALPEGNGISVLQAIRGHDPSISAIALTGISDPKVRQQALDAGFNRYFIKPVDYQALIQAVYALAFKGKKLSA